MFCPQFFSLRFFVIFHLPCFASIISHVLLDVLPFVPFAVFCPFDFSCFVRGFASYLINSRRPWPSLAFVLLYFWVKFLAPTWRVSVQTLLDMFTSFIKKGGSLNLLHLTSNWHHQWVAIVAPTRLIHKIKVVYSKKLLPRWMHKTHKLTLKNAFLLKVFLTKKNKNI